MLKCGSCSNCVDRSVPCVARVGRKRGPPAREEREERERIALLSAGFMPSWMPQYPGMLQQGLGFNPITPTATAVGSYGDALGRGSLPNHYMGMQLLGPSLLTRQMMGSGMPGGGMHDHHLAGALAQDPMLAAAYAQQQMGGGFGAPAAYGPPAAAYAPPAAAYAAPAAAAAGPPINRAAVYGAGTNPVAMAAAQQQHQARYGLAASQHLHGMQQLGSNGAGLQQLVVNGGLQQLGANGGLQQLGGNGGSLQQLGGNGGGLQQLNGNGGGLQQLGGNGDGHGGAAAQQLLLQQGGGLGPLPYGFSEGHAMAAMQHASSFQMPEHQQHQRPDPPPQQH